MRPVRGADHDQPRYPLRIPLPEGERHHAAVRAAGDGAQRLDAEMIEKALQRLGLVVTGNAGEGLALARAGRLAAAADVVEAQDAKLSRCRWRRRDPRSRSTSPAAHPRRNRHAGERRCLRAHKPPVHWPGRPGARQWKGREGCRRGAARNSPGTSRMPSRTVISAGADEGAWRNAAGTGTDSSEAFIRMLRSSSIPLTGNSAERPPAGGFVAPIFAPVRARSHADRSSVALACEGAGCRSWHLSERVRFGGCPGV